MSNDYKIAKLFTAKDIKITIPGPLSILDMVNNKYYENKRGKRWVIYSNEIDASKMGVSNQSDYHTQVLTIRHF